MIMEFGFWGGLETGVWLESSFVSPLFSIVQSGLAGSARYIASCVFVQN
jgi:hypothetical protein